ncbi:preprotein translocase subunit SecG [Beijerinckiaceae bacterium]|nr:preprotein translocase subunit SecG [Beijerinckiaceae bacterium]
MQSVLIVIHLMVVVALVVTVLLQRSEGGALGVGGGGGFMTGRGQANVLTRLTAILGALFFATSLGLTVLARLNQGPETILQSVKPVAPTGDAAKPDEGKGNLLDQLRRLEEQKTSGTGIPGLTLPPGGPLAPMVPAPESAVPQAPSQSAPAAPGPVKPQPGTPSSK